jgi:predicted transcriptional regulator
LFLAKRDGNLERGFKSPARDRCTIQGDILRAISQKPQVITRIMQRARLSYGMTKEILPQMESAGLLSFNKANRTFEITDIGKQALSHYVKFRILLIHARGEDEQDTTIQETATSF